MNNVSIKTLRRILDYDPNTGEMIWRERPVSMFASGGPGGAATAAKKWNAQFSGSQAFKHTSKKGYRQGAIFGKTLWAHRVVWAIHNGAWPTIQIDHINGIRDDNRICNLRSVSHAENSRNRALRSDNTSGVCGVWFCKKRDKWNARIVVDGVSINRCGFEKMSDAAEVKKALEIKYGFHKNHGRAK